MIICMYVYLHKKTHLRNEKWSNAEKKILIILPTLTCGWARPWVARASAGVLTRRANSHALNHAPAGSRLLPPTLGTQVLRFIVVVVALGRVYIQGCGAGGAGQGKVTGLASAGRRTVLFIAIFGRGGSVGGVLKPGRKAGGWRIFAVSTPTKQFYICLNTW